MISQCDSDCFRIVILQTASTWPATTVEQFSRIFFPPETLCREHFRLVKFWFLSFIHYKQKSSIGNKIYCRSISITFWLQLPMVFCDLVFPCMNGGKPVVCRLVTDWLLIVLVDWFVLQYVRQLCSYGIFSIQIFLLFLANCRYRRMPASHARLPQQRFMQQYAWVLQLQLQSWLPRKRDYVYRSVILLEMYVRLGVDVLHSRLRLPSVKIKISHRPQNVPVAKFSMF